MAKNLDNGNKTNKCQNANVVFLDQMKDWFQLCKPIERYNKMGKEIQYN
jgi:hypothetical protein